MWSVRRVLKRWKFLKEQGHRPPDFQGCGGFLTIVFQEAKGLLPKARSRVLILAMEAKMTGLYTDLAEYYVFDKQKYSLELSSVTKMSRISH